MRKLLFSITLFSLFASMIPKSQAQSTDSVTYKEPAWLFPIWFKNAFGEVDTVWFGHDNLASWQIDSMFNEGVNIVDTSKFNATLMCNNELTFDSCNKIRIDNFNQFNYTYIFFHKGYKPLTMYWDKSLFYSDSLPYPDLGDLPRARGDVYCSNAIPCSTSPFPIVMTDRPDSLSGFWPFVESDSIYFEEPPIGMEELYSVLIYIRPYDYWVGIEEQSNSEKKLMIYPNPSPTIITIEFEENIDFNYRIYNMLGEEVLAEPERFSKKVEINISGLHKGIYYVSLPTENGNIVGKFIKE